MCIVILCWYVHCDAMLVHAPHVDTYLEYSVFGEMCQYNMLVLKCKHIFDWCVFKVYHTSK